MRSRQRGKTLLAWVLAVPCFAGPPNYDAFSEKDGYIATDQQQVAVWALLHDPEQLESVYRDVVGGNQRAVHVFQQLEATFSASGWSLAEKVSQPPCLIPGFRELSRMCVPDWSALSYLSQDKPGGARLRHAIYGAFARRARERGLENQLILSAATGFISVELARAALVQAQAAPNVSKLPGAVNRPSGVGGEFAAHVSGSEGVLASLGQDGILDLYIKAGPSTPRGGQMFNEALAAFGPNVKGIRGTWIGGGDMADNFNAFKAATAAGQTPEVAAFGTFTGKMSQRAGFTKVRIISNQASKVVVEFYR